MRSTSLHSVTVIFKLIIIGLYKEEKEEKILYHSYQHSMHVHF